MHKWLVVVGVVLLFLTIHTNAEEEADDAGKETEEEFDGIGIALVDRPAECEKHTRKGDLVRVTFNGTIGDSTGAFSTRYETEQLEFVLGDGEMIPGFDAGCVDMCVGETRHLTIPSQYAYGTNGMGTEIPARTTLYFYVTLHSMEALPRHKSVKPNSFAQIDADNNMQLSHDEVKTYLKNVGVVEMDGEGGLHQITRDVFKEEDRNQNGVIEHEEFSGIRHPDL